MSIKEINARYYIKNRDNIIIKRKQSRGKIRKVINEIKENTPCMDCGIKYPYYVMDFDHLRDKKFQISRVTAKGITIEKALLEIKKCDLVCANCHRIRTFTRIDNSKVE